MAKPCLSAKLKRYLSTSYQQKSENCSKKLKQSLLVVHAGVIRQMIKSEKQRVFLETLFRVCLKIKIPHFVMQRL